jgi:hypothetical protein
MALRAKYEADFQDFYAAVDTANRGLQSWETAGADVEKQMDAIASSLSGAPVVQDTTSAAVAVGVLGEQAAAVPPHIRDIADESSKLPSIFTSIAATVAGAFTVQQVINFGVNVIDTAARIGDMADKLGVSAEALQRFGFAADQNGASLDTIERAIGTMNRTLAGGSDSTIAALESVGLSFDDIRNKKPEDAFTDIADAIAKIEDPMVRAKVATELFGKAGAELLPAFLAHIKEVGLQTTVMSDDTIKRLKAAQDAWGRLANAVTIHTGEAIAGVIRMTESWKDFAIGIAVPSWLRDDVRKALDSVYDASEHAGKSIELTAEKTQQAAPRMAASLDPVVKAALAAGDALGDMNQQATFTSQVFGFVEPKLGSLTSFVRDAHKETETWNTKLRFTSEVIGELPPKLEAAAAAIQNVTAAAQSASSVSKNAPGSVGVNLGNVVFPMGVESAMKNYTARYGSGSSLGSIGGGTMLPDFISWAKSMGLAQTQPTFPATGGGGAPIANTFNIVDTESEIARRVSEEIARQIQRGSLVQ